MGILCRQNGRIDQIDTSLQPILEVAVVIPFNARRRKIGPNPPRLLVNAQIEQPWLHHRLATAFIVMDFANGEFQVLCVLFIDVHPITVGRQCRKLITAYGRISLRKPARLLGNHTVAREDKKDECKNPDATLDRDFLLMGKLYYVVRKP